MEDQGTQFMEFSEGISYKKKVPKLLKIKKTAWHDFKPAKTWAFPALFREDIKILQLRWKNQLTEKLLDKHWTDLGLVKEWADGKHKKISFLATVHVM